MVWLQPVDSYCERLGPGLWAEPLNAMTNLAFLLAAVVMWRRCRGLLPGRALAVVLALIGLGSGLFHSFANRLTGIADVLPIVAFILTYVFLASRHFLRLGRGASLLAALGVVPYAAATVPLWARLPGLGSSAGYAPVPLLILVYALLLRRSAPETARGLLLGALMLCLSIALRALDLLICAGLPSGTHFLWHLLNAAMLGWMIEVYRRHSLAALGPGR